MEGYVIGLAVGLGAGLGAGIAIGISIGRKQKPWSELDEKEKRVRITAIVAGSILFITGVVIFLMRLFS